MYPKPQLFKFKGITSCLAQNSVADNSFSRGPIFHVLNGIRSLPMPDDQFLNFMKFEFSYQVALVGKDHFIFKSLTLFDMTI